MIYWCQSHVLEYALSENNLTQAANERQLPGNGESFE